MVWTKKHQVASLSTAESEGLNLHLGAAATMCLVNRRGLGKAKHVDVQNLWIQEAYRSGKFVTKTVGTNVNPADWMTKPLSRPKIEQLMTVMGDRFGVQYLEQARLHCTRLVSSPQCAQ